MRRGGFSAGYELFGQIFISGGHAESTTTAAGRNMHVSGIQDEGDCPFNGGETVHLHGQLRGARRIAANGATASQQTQMGLGVSHTT